MASSLIFDTQGHRGCRGLMPENTIPAMLKALDLGVNTLEMDVVISKDEMVLLSHEPYFNHEITTTPQGSNIDEKEEHLYNIYNMPYHEIKRYDVGCKAHPQFVAQQKLKVFKPLLSDVFTAVKNYMATAVRPYPFFNIEIKSLPATDNIYHPEPPKFVELLMKVIIENGMEEHVNIQSFDFRPLRYLHKHYPLLPIAILIEDDDSRSLQEHVNSLGFTPSIYSPEQSLVTQHLINDCHNMNMKIIPWTVNDAEKIKAFRLMGVDGIITDYPNLF